MIHFIFDEPSQFDLTTYFTSITWRQYLIFIVPNLTMNFNLFIYDPTLNQFSLFNFIFTSNMFIY